MGDPGGWVGWVGDPGGWVTLVGGLDGWVGDPGGWVTLVGGWVYNSLHCGSWPLYYQSAQYEPSV